VRGRGLSGEIGSFYYSESAEGHGLIFKGCEVQDAGADVLPPSQPPPNHDGCNRNDDAQPRNIEVESVIRR
jgi:hypothetical protein